MLFFAIAIVITIYTLCYAVKDFENFDMDLNKIMN